MKLSNSTINIILTILFWGLPAAKIILKKKQDDRFFFRQWIFPGQYLLQLHFEKWTGNRRIAVRVLHILFLFICTFINIMVLGLLDMLIFHFHLMSKIQSIIILYYTFASSIAYWFQPFAHQIYKTK